MYTTDDNIIIEIIGLFIYNFVITIDKSKVTVCMSIIVISTVNWLHITRLHVGYRDFSCDTKSKQ